MILHENKVSYLTFEIFDKLDFVRHAFSTRVGGVSKGCYESLNLGLNRGDDPDDVITNYILFAREIGFDYNNMVLSDQVHGKEIYNVKQEDRGKGIVKESDIKNIDGLITNIPNLILTTFYADCTPLFFADIKKRVIAISHSGWKGTVLKIGEATLNEMIEKYNSDVRDILIGIGPSICKDCFEVDEPVYLEFKGVFDYIDDYCVKKGIKYYIDTKSLIKRTFLDLGIIEKNIEVSEFCTKCRPDLFYSHRYSGGERGSLAGFIELNSYGE